MEQNQYQYRLIKLLDAAYQAHEQAENSPPAVQHRLMLSAKEATAMANALSLGIIALSLGELNGNIEQLVDIGNVMADDLNNVAGTFVESDLMDEDE